MSYVGFPGFGHPGFGHPGFGHPGFGHPGFGHPGFGHPGFGFPGFGFPGFGHHGFGRRFSPFFFLSPFRRFGFREEDERDRTHYAEYTVEAGDTMWKIAQEYNIPLPILIAVNPHIQNPDKIIPSEKVYIPRMCDMYCKMMYMEEEMSS